MNSRNQQLCVRLGKGWLLLVMMMFVFHQAWVPVAVSSEIVLPMKDNVLMQTNGPDSEFDDGDYWSHRDHGNAAHQFILEVPVGLNPDFIARIQLWDPESFSTSEMSATDTDEQKGNGWEATTFTLYSPTSVEIFQRVYDGGDPASNQQWVNFYDLRLGDYGPGHYLITVRVEGDDQNGYKIGLVDGDADGNAANGNEIKLWAKRTAFQYVGEGELCNTFYFRVTQQPTLNLYNFDMDHDGSSITYISPGGVEYPGTVSGDAVWNTAPETSSLPMSGGDVIQNPEPGWWRAVVCVSHPTPYVRDGNQFIFWPDDLLFNGPPPVAGSIGDRVWIDADQDGLQDEGEEGLPNVTVRLINGVTNMPIRSTTTDLSGKYLFEDVPAGTYRIEWILPDYFFFTAPRVGMDQGIDSDADPFTGLTGAFYFPGNLIRLDIDAGMIPKRVSNLRIEKTVPSGEVNLQPGEETMFLLTVTNQGPHDANNVRIYDNIPDGLEFLSATRVQDEGPNPLVWLETLLPAGETVTYRVYVRATNVIGEFENCAWVSGPNKDIDLTDNSSCVVVRVTPDDPNESDILIGDRVWLDQNGNGLQDAGEPGMGNVTVNLLSGIDETLVAATATDANGYYQFEDMPAGSYKVAFVLPANHSFTVKNQGANPAIDSDPNQVTGISDAFTVVNGTAYLTWDAGLVPYSPPPESNILIGDRVWRDANNNGIQDAGEPGMPNITVNLLSGLDETLVASMVTDANGNYLFEDMPPGAYKVGFVLPAGYSFSPQNMGGDPAMDSDPDQVRGISNAFTVAADTDYLMWDAGMVPYTPPPQSNIRIGDLLWNDVNEDGYQNPTEPGIPNVQVFLLTGADQSIVASTTTDANGNYLFEDMPPGSYRVAFNLLPGFHFTTMNAGADDEKDSDVDPTTGRSAAFTVVSETDYLMWDAGMVRNSESDLEIEKVIEENRSYIYRGESVTFIITVTNHGPDVARNVTIIDNLPVGLEFVSADRAQDEGPNPLIWREAMIPVGGSITYRILMRTTLELGGMDNCVTVSSASFDPDLTNNMDCAQVHILVPVELSSFSAKSTQGRVQLNWVTQSETENMGFHILRSEAPEGTYLQINRELIPGHGTTSSAHIYQFVDESELAPSRSYYYKLVDVDYKGRLNTHGPVSTVVELPTHHILEQNYPNPFNPETRISFTLKEAGEVALVVYNVRGEIVRTLVSGRLNAGAHMKVWDGKDNNGMTVPSGMYIYTLRINNFEEKRNMMFLK